MKHLLVVFIDIGTILRRSYDIVCTVPQENQPWAGRKTLVGSYMARSNIGKLTLGSGYNSRWYIWSWGVSDSGLEQVIAKRQKMLQSTGVEGSPPKNAPHDCFVRSVQCSKTFLLAKFCGAGCK